MIIYRTRIGVLLGVVCVSVFLTVSCDNGPFSVQSADLPEAVTVSPDDPFFTPDANGQWYLNTINAPAAWGLYEANAGVTYAARDMQPVIVSVIDNGIVGGHEDLAPVLSDDGMYFVNGAVTPIPVGMDPNELKAQHGTHVAGLVGAQGGNGRGISGGVYNGWPRSMVLLRPIVALDGRGLRLLSDLILSIHYAAGVDNGYVSPPTKWSAVMNMSLGGDTEVVDDVHGLDDESLSLLGNAIRAAAMMDVVMVAASGNDGGDAVDYPAAYPEVIAVGSIDQDETLSFFSDFGPEQELVAPGAFDESIGLYSTVPGNGYSRTRLDDPTVPFMGTSMAAPLVAAAAALVRSANPYLSAEEVRTILQETARNLGPSGWDPEYGYGLVDMEAALRRALSEPYGRFSSSAVPSKTIIPQQLSIEQKTHYDNIKAETNWDPNGPHNVSVLVAADGDIAAITTLPGVILTYQGALPDGTFLRLRLESDSPEATFEAIRAKNDVLLLFQERPRVFLQSPIS